MSASEAERFANDLKTKKDLLDELKKSAGGLGLSGIVQFAKKKGYSFTDDDAKQYIEKKAHKELTDQQLDRIAGGKGGGSTTVSSTVAATTYSVAATVTDIGQAVGGVTVAVVAAVIVVT